MADLKAKRKAGRTAFSKLLRDFNEKVEIEEQKDTSKAIFLVLEENYEEMNVANTDYLSSLYEKSQVPEKEIQDAIDSNNDYKIKFKMAKLRYDKEFEKVFEPIFSSANNSQIQMPVTTQALPFKRPVLEIKKFNGNVGEWINFWSSFKKYHEDSLISKEDKFMYLKMSMEKGSKAEKIVDSYPTSAENYEKAVESLKNRFGRHEVLVQYYVRKLLALVLQNATNKDKKVSVSNIYDELTAHLRSLESLGVMKNEYATILYPLVESSLPEEILRTWQRAMKPDFTESIQDSGISNNQLSKLLEFLKSEVENEERILMAVHGFGGPVEKDKKERGKYTKGKDDSSRQPATASVLLSNERAQTEEREKKVVCIFCKENHDNASCLKARDMLLDKRKQIISENKCCFRCVKPGHSIKNCHVKIKCSWCGYSHSILVCSRLNSNYSTNNFTSNKSSDEKNDKDKSVKEQALASFSDLPEVYLQTLKVILFSDFCEKPVRAIIDSGSQRSYIRADIAKKMQYEPRGAKEIIHSLFGGASSANEIHNIYLVRLKSMSGDYKCNFECLDQKIICSDIPRIKIANWTKDLKDKNISLCDSYHDSTTTDSIDMLIGADIAGKLSTGKKFDLSNGLTAIETVFGWTVMGKIKNNEQRESITKLHTMFVENAKVSDLWSLDSLGIRDPIEKTSRSLREQAVKDDFLKSVNFTEEKRYSVNLPWIEDHAPLSENFELAEKRLEYTVKKLKGNKIYDDYNNVFSEWLQEGIIEIVPDDEISNMAHYLPHRPVIKNESTTKIRPVFDASASIKGYPSVNECLETGQNLIELVLSSLMRLREDEIAVVADIKKAFLQIEINKKDRDFLRFLWFVEGAIRIFRHCRVVFGLTCSPFLLGAVIEFHLMKILDAIKNQSCTKWSLETIIKLIKSFYVDNCTTSVKNKDELSRFIRESKEIMLAGGFDLRGWEYTQDGSEKSTTLVLGVLFNKVNDTLLINPGILINRPEKVTKRSILSATHKVFDPLGFTCPVTLLPKLLLKNLWEKKIDWDTPVDENIAIKFLNWCDQIELLKTIEIPRKFGSGDWSVHVFTDASKEAIATVLFLRVENDAGVDLKFISARSRIAPKKATIPRLELLAACIGSRLLKEISEVLDLKNVPVHYWSDSSTALSWIEQDSQWGVFVYNRVKEIREISLGKWRHVPGTMNPADLPSRGCTAKQLLDFHWWEGPDWLRENRENWPQNVYEINQDEVNKELKKSVVKPQISMLNREGQNFQIRKVFSSYDKLIRFFAIMNRFKKFKLKKEIYKGKHLTLQEINATEIIFMKQLQREMFLSKNDPKLSMFETFMHEDGTIRLQTKISERIDDPQFLYPIILDGNHEMVKLIIKDAHEKMCHAGVQVLMCYLRQKYWILSMRKTIKSVVYKCVICKKHSVKRLETPSVPLPIHRVRDAAVFEVVGVDFAGPVFLRDKKKGWICLFTCAVYRAVHLELVSSLSTKSFLAALRRFISRRGRCSIIYSDNGRNFVGAHNAFKDLNWNEIAKYSNARQIDWRFNPPTAAWWGGWWERLIGSVKKILRRILGKACLSYEEFDTILCDCELTINSRPLTYVSEDPGDLQPLTPSMFLHEVKNTECPDIDLISKVKFNARYKYQQGIMEQLRKRFREEYLSQLVLKPNKKERRIIHIGDIVLIGDDSKKRIDWLLARVEQMIVGRDGQARVAILKTKDGKLKRPLQRIYPLEVTSEDRESSENGNPDDMYCLSKELRESICQKDYKKMKKQKSCIDDLPVNETKTRSGRVSKKPDFYEGIK